MAETVELNAEANPFSFKNFVISNDTKKDNTHELLDKKGNIIKKDSKDNPYSFAALYSKESDNDVSHSGTNLDSVFPEIGLNDSSNHPEKSQTDFAVLQGETATTLQYHDKCESNVSYSRDILELPLSGDETNCDHKTLPSVSLSSDLSDDLMQTNINLKCKTLVINSDNNTISDEYNYYQVQQHLLELKAENSVLKTDLQVMKRRAKQKTQRIKELEAELIALQKKENEETAALEDIIQKVETNLKSTTEQAVTAEKYAEGLKQEVKTLQKTVQDLTLQNQHLQVNQNNIYMEEKIKYVSHQLGVSAKTAEESLKHLLEGVDNLKLLSETLLSVDKFTEIENDESSADTY